MRYPRPAPSWYRRPDRRDPRRWAFPRCDRPTTTPTIVIVIYGGTAMSASSGPAHLTSHHRTTLEKILQHPAGHNIEWHDVLSLLRAVGTVVEHHDGKVAVTVAAD